MPNPPNPLQPFLDAITPVIRDDDAWVTADLSRFVLQTIQQRYSKDRPLEIVSDVPGDGSAYLPLPTAPAGQQGTFDPLFSILTAIEYPIGEIPTEDVEPGDWELYRAPTGYRILLNAYNPNPGENVRLTWTCQHAVDGSTIPQGDFYAVCDYAASLALEAMAAYAAQLGDATMGADSNNYRGRSSQYLSLAKAKRRAYFDHLGIKESDSDVEDRPVFAVGRLDNILSSAGVDRLVHGRFTR